MGKYYDELVSINESLNREIKDLGLVAEDDSDSISIPKDSLTDEQKKDLLKDNGVDASTVDGMKDSDELDSALDATLNNDSVKKESKDEGSFIIRMDDDDLDMHGYVEFRDNVEKLNLTDEIGGAAKYGSEEKANNAISEFCATFHYDPNTFKVEPANERYDGLDDGEGWISLDPSHPGASTIS